MADDTLPPPTKKLARARRRLEKLERQARVVPRGPYKPKLVAVTLARRHSLGSHLYGPGAVQVPKAVAEVLLEQERNAQREEARFYDPQPMARAVGDRGKVHLVDPAQLEGVLGSGLVSIGTLSGR